MSDVPSCMIKIDDNTYQCQKFGFIIKPKRFPVTCSICMTTPSLPRRAVNFARAAAKHIASGLQHVPKDEFTRRITICNGCELRDGKICTHPECGCFLNTKCWWADQHCPIHKWDEWSGV